MYVVATVGEGEVKGIPSNAMCKKSCTLDLYAIRQFANLSLLSSDDFSAVLTAVGEQLSVHQFRTRIYKKNF